MDSVRLNQLAELELKTADAFHEQALSAQRLYDEMEIKADQDYLEVTALGVPDSIALPVLRQAQADADKILREGEVSLEKAQYHLDRARELQRLRNQAKVRELRVRFSDREA